MWAPVARSVRTASGFVFIAFLAIGATGSLAENTDELEPQQRIEIEAVIRSIKDEAPFPAISVVVNRGGHDVYAEAFGTADLENHVPAAVDSVYAIGSITKSFTALAVLQLIAAGEISIHDTVRSVLEHYSGPGRDATIEQLLTHTSGIPNYLNEIPSVRGTFERRAVTREQMRDYFANEALLFTPGTGWSYSNSGYYLLGLIVEAVSGQTYYAYLAENVFQPYGLASTYAGDDREVVPKRVRGYELVDSGFVNAAPWHYLAPFAAGSLLSSATDVARYRRAIFQSDDTSRELRELITETSKLADGTAHNYTLGGLVYSNFHGRRKYSHSGEIYGFSANHAHYPDDDLTVVILTNHKGASPSPVTMERKIARTVLGIPARVTVDKPLTEALLRRYAGDYALHPIRFGPPVYGFAAIDGRLFLKPGGRDSSAEPIPLLAQGDGSFVAADDDEWTFRFDDAGPTSSRFEMTVRDATVRGRRID